MPTSANFTSNKRERLNLVGNKGNSRVVPEIRLPTAKFWTRYRPKLCAAHVQRGATHARHAAERGRRTSGSRWGVFLRVTEDDGARDLQWVVLRATVLSEPRENRALRVMTAADTPCVPALKVCSPHVMTSNHAYPRALLSSLRCLRDAMRQPQAPIRSARPRSTWVARFTTVVANMSTRVDVSDERMVVRQGATRTVGYE